MKESITVMDDEYAVIEIFKRESTKKVFYELMIGVGKIQYIAGTDYLRGQKNDLSFIAHIKSHLKDGEDVVCKICGMTLRKILEEKSEDEDDE